MLPDGVVIITRSTEKRKIMKITLKDGSFKEYESAMAVIDIAKDISLEAVLPVEHRSM